MDRRQTGSSSATSCLPVIRGSMTLDPVYNTRIPGSTEVIVLIMLRGIALKSFSGIVAVALATCVYTLGQSRSGPVDPGVRGGPASAGTPLKGLRADETAFFQDGQARFAEIEVVTKGANNGLGPRFNSNQCFSCHSQPDAGGSSPAKNPLPAVAGLNGAKNTVPWFITHCAVYTNTTSNAKRPHSRSTVQGEQRSARRLGARTLRDHRAK